MNNFRLDPRLEQDTHYLTELGNNTLLLNRNACFYWFILVPHTTQTELYQVEDEQQQEILKLINILSECINTHFKIDKLNVASLGNVVEQLHIHIIGRRHDDVAWPQPIWNCTESKDYSESEIDKIKEIFSVL